MNTTPQFHDEIPPAGRTRTDLMNEIISLGQQIQSHGEYMRTDPHGTALADAERRRTMLRDEITRRVVPEMRLHRQFDDVA